MQNCVGKSPNDAFEVWTRAETNRPPERWSEVLNPLATFIADRRLAAETLERYARRKDKALSAALVQVMHRMPTNDAVQELVAAKLDTFEVNESWLQLQAGDALRRLNREAAAAAWYQKALASTNPVDRLGAARRLKRNRVWKLNVARARRLNALRPRHKPTPLANELRKTRHLLNRLYRQRLAPNGKRRSCALLFSGN